MNSNIKQLISGHLDEVLTNDQQDELAGWIKADPANADQFAEAVFLDNRLHAEVNAAQYKDLSKNQSQNQSEHQQEVVPASTVRPPIRRWWPQIAAALATCLVIAVTVGVWLTKNDAHQLTTDSHQPFDKPSFASIAQIIGAEWDDNDKLSIGDRLSTQTIQLRSGFLRLVFDDGVEVTLQGPAEYELLAAGRTKLTSGLLTATVPPGAEGFTVDTPTAEVVDLGTAFGIDLQEDGVSRVSVFEGEVEVSPTGSTETKLLKEGEAVRIANGAAIESVEFDPEPFTKVWPVASGIERSTEEFRFVPPWPPQQRFIRSDDNIFIAAEGHISTLSSLLRVNVSSPGMYSHKDNLNITELPAGQQIRSFTLFFHPEKSGPRQPPTQISGNVTFDSPVLGLIVLHDELQASARRFTRFGPRNIRESQQLELSGDEDSDVITLSEDRRTVTLKLTARSGTGELMRVIVDAAHQTSIEQAN